MTALELVKLLLDGPLDAEVMVQAPLECARGPVVDREGHPTGRLDLPTLGVARGTFYGEPTGPREWVAVRGCGAWRIPGRAL